MAIQQEEIKDHDCKSCLVAKVFSDRSFHFIGLEEALLRSWNKYGKVTIAEYHEDLVLARFENDGEMEKSLVEYTMDL